MWREPPLLSLVNNPNPTPSDPKTTQFLISCVLLPQMGIYKCTVKKTFFKHIKNVEEVARYD
jgi:hypothetical protein